MPRVEEYNERKLELAGWEIQLTTYKLGNIYHCRADNVSPGAALARTNGATRDEAEAKAIERAGQLLIRTHRHEIE
jgi:hypothetical protein